MSGMLNKTSLINKKIKENNDTKHWGKEKKQLAIGTSAFTSITTECFINLAGKARLNWHKVNAKTDKKISHNKCLT